MKKKIFVVVPIIVLMIFLLCSCNQLKGASAYDIAVKNGFKGTEKEWLQSLKGNTKQEKSDSAYDIAVKNGFKGTEKDWLTSLYSKNFSYDEAKKNGFKGSYDDFMNHVIRIMKNEFYGGQADDVAAKCIKSIVSINTTYDQMNEYGEKSSVVSAGAGVIFELDKANGNAYIVTNFHVIYNENSDTLYPKETKVFLYGLKYSDYAMSAKIIGGTASYDLAVIKIENSDILKKSLAEKAKFASEDKITVGKKVVAIGNPQGKGISVTSGIVSVESENIDLESPKNSAQKINIRVVRIDAAVNGGNSGGGLFNSDGELIGIVNAKSVKTNVENIAYAIPVFKVSNILKNIRANCDGNQKQIKKCVIGIMTQIADVKVSYDSVNKKVCSTETIKVKSINADSIAKDLLKVGDIIKKFTYNGKTLEIKKHYQLSESLLQCTKGDKIVLQIQRDGVDKNITLVLSNSVLID